MDKLSESIPQQGKAEISLRELVTIVKLIDEFRAEKGEEKKPVAPGENQTIGLKTGRLYGKSGNKK